MVNRFCVVGCGLGVPLYPFPLEGEMNRRREWMRLLGVTGPTPKYIFACQRHFSLKVRGKRLLNRSALPDINLRIVEPPVTFEEENDLGSTADPVIVLGVEDFQPVFFSPEEAGREEEIHQPFSDVELNSSLDRSLIDTWANSRQIQTDTYLTDGTPRKRKYREVLKEKDEELGQLRKKVAVLENKVFSLEKKVFNLEENPDLAVARQDSQVEELCSRLPPHVALCVRNSLKNTSRTPKGYRFGRELKTLALAVKFIAPLAYRYLKPLLIWPSRTTLEQFVQSWPRNPGCNYSSIKALELRSRGFTDAQKYVSICCDEMYLKVFVQYERNRDLIIGLEDYGDDNRTSRVASSVLAVLVQGIGGELWTHPLAYFFVNKYCPSDALKTYIFEIIGQLQSIGLHPCQMVTDQGSNFWNFARLVGVCPERPFFEVNGQEITYFFDSPHLIKSTRNCLENEKNRVSFADRPVDWMDIVHVYEQGSQYDISCTYKLTSKHVRPTKLNKMSVQLATQVFSNSVASAMFSIHNSGRLNSSRSPSFFNTAEFVLFFDKLFNIFNSSYFGDLANFKQPFQATADQLGFLEEAERFLMSIKIYDINQEKYVTNTYKFIKGWILNINSLRHLWRFLSQNEFTFLFTRRLCSDKIENFFGHIRRGGSFDSRITPQRFSYLFRQAWGISYIKCVEKGNCELLPEDKWEEFSNSTIIAACNDALVRDTSWQLCLPTRKPKDYNDVQIDIFVDVDESSFLHRSAFVYFCGYMYFKYFKHHNCLMPLERFEDGITEKDFIFTKEKQFANCQLVCPPDEFVEFISKLENIYTDNFDATCHMVGFSQILFEKMIDVEPYYCCENCNPDVIKCIFIRIRTYFLTNSFNKKKNDGKIKHIKFLHLTHTF